MVPINTVASWSSEEEKMTCVTTDNGQYIVKAISINEWIRLQCFGHRLHLAIGKLLFFLALKLSDIGYFYYIKDYISE